MPEIDSQGIGLNNGQTYQNIFNRLSSIIDLQKFPIIDFWREKRRKDSQHHDEPKPLIVRFESSAPVEITLKYLKSGNLNLGIGPDHTASQKRELKSRWELKNPNKNKLNSMEHNVNYPPGGSRPVISADDKFCRAAPPDMDNQLYE